MYKMILPTAWNLVGRKDIKVFKKYFRHASGEVYVISKALTQFISINRFILRTYAHNDVSTGSWFIGLDVMHIDENKFCCSSWSAGSICAGV
ncbi:hydroxyproline O-galactosyltransferase HPGT1-like isoform X2 [Trifolium pratense]|uniref:hydroxyproline O-galactosyltransferase HPGT1-like isoform X2 n=1 Tax=Trifolium pratense TaxID=57577 RepID=UPI001E691D81|nr:hydroxyproline O-galactosyltransferase HPGT1-like isoform X2 [Trifolium pratense]